MQITRPADAPTRFGPAGYFTGTVLLDPLVEAPAPARVRMARVTFLPGARTFWHTHPLGQTLHVVAGVCLLQSEGGPRQAAHPGDTVWIAPGEKHWHGATPDQSMVHLALQEAEDGEMVTWLEPVSEADYRGNGG